MVEAQNLLQASRIGEIIYIVRGRKVVLDADLASLYGVETKALVRAMKRNLERFPPDFMFRFERKEFENLRCQIGTSSSGGKSWGGRRYLPFAFTEHGAVMVANTLRSERAIEASILVVRAFVRLREMLSTNKNWLKNSRS